MYRHCIYCSADLGANEAVEAFPVGRTLAFDAAKGRLWAVCGKCARWNLAPIEERWEAVEDAERHFRDTRLRVQSENIGLARLRDGTRLIRVGAALQGELAAWRYGDQLARRYRRHLLWGGAAVAGGLAAGGILFAGMGVAAVTLLFGTRDTLREAVEEHRGTRFVHTLSAHETPHGEPLRLLRRHLAGGLLSRGAGGIELSLPAALELRPYKSKAWRFNQPLLLPDRAARRVLERAMVHVNLAGASRARLGLALGRVAAAGTAEDYILHAASHGFVLLAGRDDRQTKLPGEMALALEIALHEEQERRAMEGELSILEAAWRDAEPIAAIADRLAIEPG